MKNHEDITPSLNILLADDDSDDCLFFKEALEELDLATQLTAVHDGEQLMRLLTKDSNERFHVLFLDLNMPRKNGFTCLEEIRQNDKLNHLPIIIFSTSYLESIADRLYQSGALYYICKPPDFSQLKNVIQQVLTLASQKRIVQPPIENFLLRN